jgi:hypothetical protein
MTEKEVHGTSSQFYGLRIKLSVGSFYIDPFNTEVSNKYDFKKDSKLNTFFNAEEEFYKTPFVIAVIEKMSRIFYTSYVQ